MMIHLAIKRVKLILTSFSVIVLLLNFSCALASLAGTTIEGTVRYEDINGNVVSAITENSPIVNILTEGATVQYSATLPGDLQIDPDTGVISGTATTALEATDYTVVVTGTGDYSGTIEASISITINKNLLTGNLSYENIVSTVGTAITPINSMWSDFPAGVTADYTIVPPLSSNGLALDASTGVISGTPTVPINQTYTISAVGKDNYSGTKEYSTLIVNITILLEGTITYTDIVGTVGTEITQSAPMWSTELPTEAGGITYFLQESGLPDGLAFNFADGIISGTPTDAAVGSAVYNIVAVADNTVDYSGTIFGTITITITR